MRGELFSGRLGFFMVAADCGGAVSEPDLHSWPTALDLSPASEDGFKDQELPVKIWEAWQRGRPKAIATVTGLLRVPTDEQLRRGQGFGKTRNFPAQIRYEQVSDVDFEILPPPRELPVVPLCEVFSNLQQYRSKRVAIRGRLTGGYHGGFVFDVCPQAAVLGGVRAATTMSLGQPDYDPGPELAPDFGINRPIEGMKPEPSIQEQKHGRNSVRVWGTFVGVLRALEKYEVWCVEGRARPLGFGHMNTAPAELLEEASYDFKVEPADDDPDEPELDPCPAVQRMDGESCEQREDLPEAVAAGCLQRVVQLLKAGADPNEKVEEGGTSLLIAIRQGFADIARLLLYAGAKPQGTSWETPLCVAVQHDRQEIVRLLVDRGAPVEPASDDACSPLAQVAAHSSGELVRLLLSAGANPNARTERDGTPLEAAAREHKIENMRLLIEAGADPNAVNRDGEAYLPTYGFFNPSVTQELIRVGASVDATARDGQTALMGACKYGYRAAAELLLEAGADPNRKDNAGDTPLMHAVRGGFVDCIPLLATHGVDTAATNNQGKTARDLVTGQNAVYLFEALDQIQN